MKFFGRGIGGLAIVCAGILLAGCDTAPHADYKFDPLAQNPAMAPAPAPAAPTPAMTAPTPPETTAVPTAPGTTNSGGATTPNDASPTMVHLGDAIYVTFADIPSGLMQMENTIKEDGFITLAYDQKFHADGKTIGELQAEIRDRYVPKYWKYLTVTIKIQDRYYFVGGEVRSPNRQVYTGYMTVLRAIDTAGGFTDYAWKTRVVVTRADGSSHKENCTKALTKPELDLQVFPGDRIHVPKRIF